MHDVRVGPQEVLGDGSTSAAAAVERATLEATSLLCAEMVGGARRVLEMTVDYVKVREQFGRPIGSFQAVQHQVADMATKIEAGRWATYQAAWLLAEGMAAAREVAVAKAWCSRMYPWVTQVAHHLHGGAGIVLDHDLHLYSERAKGDQVRFGGTNDQLLALMTHGAHAGRRSG
jgi:alkylation response protein AidB-like acyl-CoA dehydrogenase